MHLRLWAALDKETNGLVGGDYERDPSFIAWASYGAHRTIRKQPAPFVSDTDAHTFHKHKYTILIDLLLPSPDEVSGDEHVWVHLIAKGIHSGHSQFNSTDSNITRDMQAGAVGIQLSEVVLQALVGIADRPKRYDIVDTILYRWLKNEQYGLQRSSERDLLRQAFKGTLLLYVEVVCGSDDTEQRQQLLRAWLQACTQLNSLSVEGGSASYYGSNNPVAFIQPSQQVLVKTKQRVESTLAKRHSVPNYQMLLYNSPEMIKMAQQSSTLLYDIYMDTWCLPQARSDVNWSSSEDDSAIMRLRWMDWRTYQGGMSPAAFVTHEPSQRPRFLSNNNPFEQEFYKHRIGDAEYFEAMLHSALLATNATPTNYVNGILSQFDRKTPANYVHPDFIMCLTSMGIMISQVTVAIKYTMDMRYKNKQATDGEQVPLESFDAMPVFGGLNAGDCEDTGLFACAIVNALVQTVADLGGHATVQKRFPLLAATVRVFDVYTVATTHCVVTSAFGNASADSIGRSFGRSGSDSGNNDIDPASGLPRIGSGAWVNSTKGGHLICMVVPLYATLKMITTAKAHSGPDVTHSTTPVEEAVFERMTSDATALVTKHGQWVTRLPALVIDGTCIQEPWTLGLGEIGHYACGPTVSSAAAKLLENISRLQQERLREITQTTKRDSAIKKKLSMELDESAMAVLLKSAYIEIQAARPGLPGHVNDSTSTFYRHVTQLVMPDLVQRYGSRYGIYTPVSILERRRGVEIGRFLRACLAPDRYVTVAMEEEGKKRTSETVDINGAKPIGLVLSFYRIPHDEWMEKIVPVDDAITNQLPFSTIGCFRGLEQRERMLRHHFCSVLSKDEFILLAKKDKGTREKNDSSLSTSDSLTTTTTTTTTVSDAVQLFTSKLKSIEREYLFTSKLNNEMIQQSIKTQNKKSMTTSTLGANDIMITGSLSGGATLRLHLHLHRLNEATAKQCLCALDQLVECGYLKSYRLILDRPIVDGYERVIVCLVINPHH